MSSGGGRMIPYGSKTDALKYLCYTLNLIEMGLQPFETKLRLALSFTQRKMNELFKNIPLTTPE